MEDRQKGLVHKVDRTFFEMSRPINRYKEFVARLALAKMEINAAIEQCEWLGEKDEALKLKSMVIELSRCLEKWREKFKNQLK